jgi:uncharacterized protein (TIGR00251 family)
VRKIADGPFYSIEKDRLLLSVKVHPGAGKNSVVGSLKGELIVKIKARPQKGKANSELVSVLAKRLGIPKSAVQIVSGSTSRHKILLLDKECLPAVEALARCFKDESV